MTRLAPKIERSFLTASIIAMSSGDRRAPLGNSMTMLNFAASGFIASSVLHRIGHPARWRFPSPYRKTCDDWRLARHFAQSYIP
ncbi:MAG: hypothetical protein ABSF67_21310 [Roseiarcus sp.]